MSHPFSFINISFGPYGGTQYPKIIYYPYIFFTLPVDSLIFCAMLYFLLLSPPGWRGIVVMVRAGSCKICGTHISATAWRIFSVWSSVELSRPLCMHCHAHLLICPYELAHGPKTCKICHKLGRDFTESISLKPLDGFTPFEVSPVRRQAIIWNNALFLSIGPLGTKFSQMAFEIQTF